MHPIERLRYVARASGTGPGHAREAATALAGFSSDPAGLVTACRRLVERSPASGATWWLCARVLSAPDPAAMAWASAEALDADPTPRRLAAALPDGASIVAVGSAGVLWEALDGRADVEVILVDDAGGDHRFGYDDERLVEVGPSALAAALDEADLLVLAATAASPTGFLAPLGSRPAAAVARHLGKPVWMAAGVGAYLPSRMWEKVESGVAALGEPWDRPVEVVDVAAVDKVVGPGGLEDPADAVRRTDCPVAPELLR